MTAPSRRVEAGDAHAPHGLMVVQVLFDVDHTTRVISERLALSGYHVLCPALFDRLEPDVELAYWLDDIRHSLLRATKLELIRLSRFIPGNGDVVGFT